MNFKTKYILLLSWLAISCIPKKDAKPTEVDYKTRALIEVGEFLALPSFDGYTVVDFRSPSEYIEGHLPEAINIWREDIEDGSFEYKGMMPSKNQLELLFSKKGIKTTDTLIVYDNRGSCDAARLWWVLDNFGFNQTRILNGGLSSYLAKGEKLSSAIPKKQESQFVLSKLTAQRHVSLEELKEDISSGRNFTLIDCRTQDEYSGYRQKKGALKAGRIPKSIWIDWASSVDYSSTNSFLPIETLEEIYGKVLPNKKEPIVVYCHTGVRSSHTTFVLTQLLGYENVRNYDGSWTEWSHYDLAYEKDVETEIFE